MAEPYHRFVFDTERRRFVGAFDEMYAKEEEEEFDSWHQEDLSSRGRRIALALVDAIGASSILDFGCGKGAVAAALKRPDNEVLGVDISPTAVAKAAERHPDVEFRVLDARELESLLSRRFDLALAMEVLSYLEDWRGALRSLARLADRLFVTLYLPPDPIGFVKSFAELRNAVSEHCDIETEVILNSEQIMLVARARP